MRSASQPRDPAPLTSPAAQTETPLAIPTTEDSGKPPDGWLMLCGFALALLGYAVLKKRPVKNGYREVSYKEGRSQREFARANGK